jgi:hypothetical protein
VDGLPLWALHEDVRALVHAYDPRLRLGERARADLPHVAFAVAYALDYLVTWNGAHLANGEVIRRLREVNVALQRLTPIIVTPEELFESPEEEEGGNTTLLRRKFIKCDRTCWPSAMVMQWLRVEGDQLGHGGIEGGVPRLLGIEPDMLAPEFEVIRGQHPAHGGGGSGPSSRCVTWGDLCRVSPVAHRFSLAPG